MPNKPSLPKLAPLLVARDAARAIDFYVEAIGATVAARYVNVANGTVAHADLLVGEATLSVTEEARAWGADAPASLGGSPVVLQLQVDDVDTSLDRMVKAGATVVFPLVDFCGERMARARDPFGHIWLLSQRVEQLTVEEIQRRRDAFVESMVAKEDAPPGASKTS